MAFHYRTQGFIFKKSDSGEADRVFTFFTKDFGKIEILAKAERKITSKLRGGLEIFYLVDIEFIQGKTHKTLTDVFLIENFKNLRKNLAKLEIAYLVAETLDNLLKGEEKDEKIWKLVLETFRRLDSYELEGKEYSLIYYYFIWNFFLILGYKPEVYSCIFCQKKLKPGKIYFSFEEGGTICGDCFKKTKDTDRIDESVVKILRIILKRDWATLSRLKIGDLQKELLNIISKKYLEFVLKQNK